MPRTTRHHGRWTIADRIASAWHHLPVEVPAGSCGLRVELEYDRSAAVLDLGCTGPAGFRGWSGGARRSFVIAPDAATPGYLAGELEPGHPWYYGVLAQVQRRADRPDDALAACRNALRTNVDQEPLTHMMRDGVLVAAGDVVPTWTAGLGLDFIAVTDHNTVSHHGELPAAAARHGITLLPGQEVTTAGGHAGALGEVGWIDFRLPADAWLEQTQRHGGLLSVNHPIAGPHSWTLPMRERPPLVEVWHWSWLDLRWTLPLAWWLAWDPDAVPVGGSDWHRPGSDAPPGRPTTWVECEGDQPGDVLDGLRAGRVAISAERDGPVLFRRDDALVAVDADGLTLAGPQGPCALVRGDCATLAGSPGPHRLLNPAGATLALCG